MNRKYKSAWNIILIPLILLSCRKSSYLNGTPDSSWVIPETLEDFTALLDNANVMNGNNGAGSVAFIGELTADNYYLLNTQIASTESGLINLYSWNDDIGKLSLDDWSLPYRAIFYSNLVLDKIDESKKPFDPNAAKIVKGRAHFFRALMNFSLAQVFCPQYDEEEANSLLGLPLRKTSQVTEKLHRSSLKETYQSILTDLYLAKEALPIKEELKTRPSKTATSALLARTFLQMKYYDSASKYAAECIGFQPELMDYNDITQSSTTSSPFIKYNKEVLFHAIGVSTNTAANLFVISKYRVDTLLYSSYKSSDLRQKYFFRSRPDGQFTFRGSYDGTANFFCGLTLDEIYLILAESLTRQSKVQEGMDVLNQLLIKRYKKNEFIPETASNSTEALNIILSERRKELLFRGLRWSDIRRLNSEGMNISLKRDINGNTFELPINDKRFTILIPIDVIALNPSWQQNIR